MSKTTGSKTTESKTTESKTTEADSHYDQIETMSTEAIVTAINQEDQTVAHAVNKAIPQIIPLINAVAETMISGGRLFYIGAGTSGRLGILDASECPPTFGVDPGQVVGLIAGGDNAIRHAVEGAEDNQEQAWVDLKQAGIKDREAVIGIAASGQTPYVIGGLSAARKQGSITGCITCNNGTDLAKAVDYPIEVVVGPEFITGSTRMKAGTAQKMVLNIISTAVMIKCGHIEGNKMVNMALSNDKLIARGTRMVMEKTDIKDPEEARTLLIEHGSVRKAVEYYNALQS